MRLNPVPARTGLVWVRLGVETFFTQPLAMGGLFFLFMGAMVALSVIPLVGQVLALALLPAVTLGLMVASQQASGGRFPMPTVLVSAFGAPRARVIGMLRLGGCYVVAFGVLLALTALADGGTFAAVYIGHTPLTEELAESPAFQQALWVATVGYLPLTLLFWHAPALVHWHGITPVKSLFFSLLACWTNKWAFLVYGLGWLGVFLLGGMVLSLLIAVTGWTTALPVLAMPTVLLMASMFFASLYFTFRDSFVDDTHANASGPENQG